VSRDSGSATIWVAGFTALIGLTGAVGVAQGGALVARHRAEVAADLAALAGASRAAAGEADACLVATSIAERNGGRLVGCGRSGDDVEVAVSRRVDLGAIGIWTVMAHARAGPADRSWSTD
jgi:secretion/DNA translocation related TadE-like protein